MKIIIYLRQVVLLFAVEILILLSITDNMLESAFDKSDCKFGMEKGCLCYLPYHCSHMLHNSQITSMKIQLCATTILMQLIYLAC